MNLAGLALAALALLALLGDDQGERPRREPRPDPDGPQREPRRTGREGLARTGPYGWALSRWRALRALLVADGMPDAVARRVAAAVVAHWARETGNGRAEWGYNVGNIKAYQGQWDGPWHRLSDGLDYRAYDALDAGIRDTLRLLRSGRYRGAWSYLVDGGTDRGWYDRLMRAGWHPWSSRALTEYADLRAMVGRAIARE
jgi:hypothetical protein